MNNSRVKSGPRMNFYSQRVETRVLDTDWSMVTTFTQFQQKENILRKKKLSSFVLSMPAVIGVERLRHAVALDVSRRSAVLCADLRLTGAEGKVEQHF